MKSIVIDIGASSYRVMLVCYQNHRFFYEELMREKTEAFYDGMYLRWNLTSLKDKVIDCIQKTLKTSQDVQSIGVCSFGVDYVYLDKEGKLIDEPISYRDKHNEDYAASALKVFSQEDIYEETGIQFLPFNTVFQLYRDQKIGRKGESLLMISDYLSYCLSGEKTNEITALSTGALIAAKTGTLSSLICQKFTISPSLFRKVMRPGEQIGYLKEEYLPKKGLKIPVIAVNTHDTSSAVTSLPLAKEREEAFLSCGSWALLGKKKTAFTLSSLAREKNFTNEWMDDGICFLKNVNGLYLINELYRAMKKEDPSLLFPSSMKAFTKEDETNLLLNVNDPLLSSPENLLSHWQEYLSQTKQNSSYSFPQIVTSFYKCLAFALKEEVTHLETLEGEKIKKLYLVGGAADIPAFVQQFATLLGVPICCGCKEATALGNAMIQISSLEKIPMEKLREELYRQEELSVYYPREEDKEKVFQEFRKYQEFQEENL